MGVGTADGVATPIAAPISADAPIDEEIPAEVSRFFTAPFLKWSLEQWLDLGFSVLIFFVFARYGGRTISWVARQITKRTSTTDDDALFAAIKQPMEWLGAIIGFQIAYERLFFITHAWRGILGNVAPETVSF